MDKLTVTVTLYLHPNETPTAIRARIQRVIEYALERPVVSIVSEVETLEFPLMPGDYTPV